MFSSRAKACQSEVKARRILDKTFEISDGVHSVNYIMKYCFRKDPFPLHLIKNQIPPIPSTKQRSNSVIYHVTNSNFIYIKYCFLFFLSSPKLLTKYKKISNKLL